MRTIELVKLIRKKSLNYKTSQEILEFINLAQNELLGEDCTLMRVSPDPFLATTKGVFTYDVDLGIRNVEMLYVRNPNVSSYGGYDRAISNYINPMRDELGNTLFKIPVYVEQSADFDIQAGITFDEEYDPGDTTNEYRLVAYSWPEQLTSTEIPLTIPVRHQSTTLLYRVMQMINEETYGASNVWDKKFESVIGEFKTDINKDLNVDNTSIAAGLG